MIKKIIGGAVMASTMMFALPNDPVQLTMVSQAAQKKAVIMANMHLKGDLNEKFGKAYDAYQQKFMKLRLERLGLIEEYAKNFTKMNDTEADKLLKKWFDLRKKEIDLQQKSAEDFKKILPASMVIRYYQMENRINLLREAKTASLIPLAIPDQQKKAK
jgi:hypothetical protein